jgi:hypothetical protein
MKRKAAKFEKPWTPFVPATLPEAAHDLLEHVGGRAPDGVAVNSRYEVWIYRLEPEDPETMPPMVHLSIKRRDRDPVRRWRDLQRIKNEVVGPDVEACEIFPCEGRLVDTSNQYHLWCLSPGARFPFGYRDRLVMEGDGTKSRQEPFEEGERPDDAVAAPRDDDEIAAMADEMRAAREPPPPGLRQSLESLAELRGFERARDLAAECCRSGGLGGQPLADSIAESIRALRP